MTTGPPKRHSGKQSAVVNSSPLCVFSLARRHQFHLFYLFELLSNNVPSLLSCFIEAVISHLWTCVLYQESHLCFCCPKYQVGIYIAAPLFSVLWEIVDRAALKKKCNYWNNQSLTLPKQNLFQVPLGSRLGSLPFPK